MSDALKLLQSFLQPKGFPSVPSDWSSQGERVPGARPNPDLFSLTLRSPEASNPYRILAVIHGQGEHLGRYLHFPHYLRDAVQQVSLFDLRGHGRSEGLRGHIDRFDEYVDDAAAFIGSLVGRAQKEGVTRGAPVELHLFGHSMGGLIALRLLLSRPELAFASATVCGPLLALKLKVPAAKQLAAYGLAHLWGNLQLSSDLDPETLSTDVAVQEAYQRDRLVHNKATPRFFVELKAAMADTLSRKGGYKTPLQFLIAMKDTIEDPDVVLSYAREVDLGDKEIRTYAEFRHESFNEIGKEAPFEDSKRWILRHSKSANGSKG